MRQQPRSDPHDHDILTTAEASPRLGVFVDFMRAAGLARLLLDDGPYTVLAPTDRAFQKLSVQDRDALLADPHRLSSVMRGHVIRGRVLPPGTDQAIPVPTIDGDLLLFSRAEGTHRIGKARLVQANIGASNGVIHAIDSLLL